LVSEQASIAQHAEEQRARELEEQRQIEAEKRKERAEERRANHQYAAEERRRNRELAKQHREWAHKPKVTEGIATKLAKKLMRESPFTIWEVECGGGKLDRTHGGRLRQCTVHLPAGADY
jgi:hypothetical protein